MVRAFQRKLYRTAKADPGRRFHALYYKVYRSDVLWKAWPLVWRNGGAPGVDRTTIADVEDYGVSRLLNEALQLRVPAQAGSSRRIAGAHRGVLFGYAVGR